MPKKLIDRAGTTYGRLTYVSFVGKNKFKQSLWSATCSCGTRVSEVQHGSAESCGCLLVERNHAPKPHSAEHCQKISIAKSAKTVERVCPMCLKAFIGTPTQRFCSVRPCQKAYFYVGNHRKKARATGAKSEPIAFWKVYDRDGGICQICFEVAPRELRGSQTDILAPELEHIIPLAKGGDHTYANVRLAHRGCNNEKADKMPEGVVQVYASPDTRTRVEKIRDATIAQFADETKRATHAAACRVAQAGRVHSQESKDRRALSMRLHFALLKALS